MYNVVLAVSKCSTNIKHNNDFKNRFGINLKSCELCKINVYYLQYEEPWDESNLLHLISIVKSKVRKDTRSLLSVTIVPYYCLLCPKLGHQGNLRLLQILIANRFTTQLRVLHFAIPLSSKRVYKST